MNNAERAAQLKKYLGDEIEPVAVQLVLEGQEVPEGVEVLEKPLFYCAMLKLAMQGSAFYAPESKHACPRGAARLGLRDVPDFEKTGDFYVSKSSAASRRSALRFVEEAPGLKPGFVAGTLIGALETATFEPDVVLIEANPLRTFELIHASIFETGGKFVTEFSAPHTICGYATVRPYLAGKLTTVIACNMARTVADSVGDAYSPEGLITGIPFEMLDGVIRNLGRLGSVRKRLAG